MVDCVREDLKDTNNSRWAMISASATGRMGDDKSAAMRICNLKKVSVWGWIVLTLEFSGALVG